MKTSNKVTSALKYSEIFAKTIKFFKHHKWGQGSMHNSQTGAYCLIGALNKVQRVELHEYTPAQIYLQKTLGLGQAVNFNDSSYTKRKDVIAALQIAHDCAVTEGK